MDTYTMTGIYSLTGFLGPIVLGAIISWKISSKARPDEDTCSFWHIILSVVMFLLAMTSGVMRGVPGSGNPRLFGLSVFFGGLLLGLEIYVGKERKNPRGRYDEIIKPKRKDD